MTLIRHGQPIITRVSPHNANSRFLKTKRGGPGGGGPSSGPAFHALAPDPTTGEMTGVLTGTGGLTTTHTATVYAPDHEGVYREFGANEPVWSGGRVVNNWVFHSDDLSQTGWEIGGDSVLVGTNQVTFNSTFASQYVRQLIQTPSSGNFHVTVSFKITGTAGAVVQLRTTFGNISDTNHNITLTGAEQYLAFSYDVTATGSTGTFQIVNQGTAPTTIVLHEVQMETTGVGEIPNPWLPTGAGVSGTPITKTFATTNGNTVTDNVVTEAPGTPLSEVPYLQYYPAATNVFRYSNSQATGWVKSGGGTAADDSVGLTGVANTGFSVSSSLASGVVFYNTTAGAVGVNIATARVYVKKSATDIIRLGIRHRSVSTPSQDTYYGLNAQTGYAWQAASDTTGTPFEVVDVGDYWLFMSSLTNPTTDALSYIYFYPAGYLADDDTALNGNAATTHEIGNVEIHDNKSIAQVRGSGPIFSTTSAVSVDQTLYDFDLANFPATEGAIYFEGQTALAETDPTISGEGCWVSHGQTNRPIYHNGSTAANLFRGDGILFGATSAGVPTAFQTQKIGTVHHFTEELSGLYDGRGAWVEGAMTEWQASYTPSLFRVLQGAASNTRKMRNLRVYTITSYQEGKDIIDGLMA